MYNNQLKLYIVYVFSVLAHPLQQILKTIQVGNVVYANHLWLIIVATVRCSDWSTITCQFGNNKIVANVAG